MAYGVRCKHCGWQETDHDEWPGVTECCGDPEKRKFGYRVSRVNCSGFTATKEDDRYMKVMDASSEGMSPSTPFGDDVT